MSLNRITVFAALGVVFAAVAAPAAFAQQDLRNPDTRDVAAAGEEYTDFRNPDTRALAESGSASPEVTVVEVPVATSSPDGGLDWGDAGIGAGGMLGLMLLAAGGTLAVAHRRTAGRGAATTG